MMFIFYGMTSQHHSAEMEMKIPVLIIYCSLVIESQINQETN